MHGIGKSKATFPQIPGSGAKGCRQRWPVFRLLPKAATGHLFQLAVETEHVALWHGPPLLQKQICCHTGRLQHDRFRMFFSVPWFPFCHRLKHSVSWSEAIKRYEHVRTRIVHSLQVKLSCSTVQKQLRSSRFETILSHLLMSWGASPFARPGRGQVHNTSRDWWQSHTNWTIFTGKPITAQPYLEAKSFSKPLTCGGMGGVVGGVMGQHGCYGGTSWVGRFFDTWSMAKKSQKTLEAGSSFQNDQMRSRWYGSESLTWSLRFTCHGQHRELHRRSESWLWRCDFQTDAPRGMCVYVIVLYHNII